MYGNTNAPPAVAYSAIIYALRCLVRRDIPLNQGCLAPVTVKIPEACMLNPSAEAAVVRGASPFRPVLRPAWSCGVLSPCALPLKGECRRSLSARLRRRHGPLRPQVGGNVLTSQRVTDVVLRAFQAAAASQGCMNNLTFGDEGMG